LAAADANINFTEGNNFSHTVSWFDIETCFKVIQDGIIGQNTRDFLLMSYSNLYKLGSLKVTGNGNIG